MKILNYGRPHNTEETFDIFDLKAMYIEDSKTTEALAFLTPNDNIATTELGAIVIEGAGGNNMLNNKMYEFTCHEKNQGRILLQLNQPYKIKSIRMLLGNDQNYLNKYSFYIETSLDKEKWQMAIDKRDESLSGWQKFEFEERPVSFIKIIGTNPDIVSCFFALCHLNNFNWFNFFLSSEFHLHLF